MIAIDSNFVGGEARTNASSEMGIVRAMSPHRRQLAPGQESAKENKIKN